MSGNGLICYLDVFVCMGSMVWIRCIVLVLLDDFVDVFKKCLSIVEEVFLLLCVFFNGCLIVWVWIWLL